MSKKNRRDTAIKDILLSEAVDWRSKHLHLLLHHYRKAPFFEEIFPYVQKLYAWPCDTLVEFNLASIRMLLDLFAVTVNMVHSSVLGSTAKGCDLLVDLLRKVKASRYLSGNGARDYYRPEPFEQAGIMVHWQKYEPVVYPQRYTGFIPNLSSIDMLFNCGIQNSRQLLRKRTEKGKRP